LILAVEFGASFAPQEKKMKAPIAAAGMDEFDVAARNWIGPIPVPPAPGDVEKYETAYRNLAAHFREAVHPTASAPALKDEGETLAIRAQVKIDNPGLTDEEILGIEQGLKDARAGRLTPIEEVRAKLATSPVAAQVDERTVREWLIDHGRVNANNFDNDRIYSLADMIKNISDFARSQQSGNQLAPSGQLETKLREALRWAISKLCPVIRCEGMHGPLYACNYCPNNWVKSPEAIEHRVDCLYMSALSVSGTGNQLAPNGQHEACRRHSGALLDQQTKLETKVRELSAVLREQARWVDSFEANVYTLTADKLDAALSVSGIRSDEKEQGK
jgi:hypothetical protein